MAPCVPCVTAVTHARLPDHPTARSSHSRVTPRAGGLAVLGGLTVAMALTHRTWVDRPEMQALVAGLACLQGLVTAETLALAFQAVDVGAASLAAALAAGCAAFLVFNWSPASVFLGDAGSGLLGFILAALPLLAPDDRRPEAIVLTGASVLLFLADATTRLVRRIYRGERWYEAHRQHLYQRWVRMGASHSTVTGWLGLGAAATSGLGLAGWWTGAAPWYSGALLLGAGILLQETALVKRLERRAAPRF